MENEEKQDQIPVMSLSEVQSARLSSIKKAYDLRISRLIQFNLNLDEINVVIEDFDDDVLSMLHDKWSSYHELTVVWAFTSFDHFKVTDDYAGYTPSLTVLCSAIASML